MTKDLTDRDQASALAQQFAGEGMAEPVWSHVWQTSTLARPLNDITDEICADRSARGFARQEQVTGVLRVSTAGQVGDQSITHLRGQRQPISPAGLATHDKFAGPPVHVA
jgi:hypothetical protein